MVTINEMATNVVFLYPIPDGLEISGYGYIPARTVQATCPPWDAHPNKRDALYSVAVDNSGEVIPVEITPPMMDIDIGLRQAERSVRRQIEKVLVSRKTGRRRRKAALEWSSPIVVYKNGG